MAIKEIQVMRSCTGQPEVYNGEMNTESDLLSIYRVKLPTIYRRVRAAQRDHDEHQTRVYWGTDTKTLYYRIGPGMQFVKCYFGENRMTITNGARRRVYDFASKGNFASEG